MQRPFPHFRVLLACRRVGEPLLRRILEPLGVEAVAAFTHEDALARIGEGVDLVLCSLRFDESRMLELIAEVGRARPHLPFLCCRVFPSDLPEASLRAAFTAAGHLGAVAVLDLPELARCEGAGRAEGALRASVAAHLQGEGRASMS